MKLKSLIKAMSCNANVLIWDDTTSKSVFKGEVHEIPEELKERKVLMITPVNDFELDENSGRRYMYTEFYIKLK